MKVPFKKRSGFSLLEMMIYIGLISGIFFVIVSVILNFSSSYRQVALYRSVERASIVSLERMIRDIRAATSVTDAQSSLGTSVGYLTIVQTANSVSTTTKFYVSNNTLEMDINGTYYGPLTDSDVSVTGLTFNHLVGSTTDAVRIDLTLQSTKGSSSKTKNYHSTIILKGS